MCQNQSAVCPQIKQNGGLKCESLTTVAGIRIESTIHGVVVEDEDEIEGVGDRLAVERSPAVGMAVAAVSMQRRHAFVLGNGDLGPNQ